jgi:hypothetical protein
METGDLREVSLKMPEFLSHEKENSLEKPASLRGLYD